MATYLANLTTRRDEIAEYLAGLTPGSGGDLPTQGGEGVNSQLKEKIEAYGAELERLNKLIQHEKDQNAADGGSVGFVESFVRP